MTLAAKWIQPRHLAAGAIAGYRAAYAADPAHVAVVTHLLHDEIATRLAHFLAAEVEFATTLGLTDRYGMCSEQEFLQAPESKRFFRYGRITGVTPAARESPLFHTYLALNEALDEPPLRALFESISGLSLAAHAGSVRRMEPGDFLVPHDDEIEDRVLSYVLYLTPGWRPEWGGDLLLERGDGQLTRVEPAFNSMVVFDARTRHHIAPIAPGAAARYTIGGWYVARRPSSE